MPTRFLLERHGSTCLTAEDRFAGSTGVPLSVEGRRQVARLAERLRGERLDANCSSPKERTLEMARILDAPHGHASTAEPAPREIADGRWQGLSRTEVRTTFPSEYAMWQEDPFTIAPLNGGSGLSVLNLALPARDEEIEPAFRLYAAGELPAFQSGGLRARLIAGEACGARSKVRTHSPLFRVHGRPDAGGGCAIGRTR
jgi:broad specificity phosphatase PhoE